MRLRDQHEIKQRLEQKYEASFQLLNEEQKKAVIQTEGPVMVLAGPGTGKTQILAMRIGQILKSTDVAPYNILCLTYTNAGRVAMRKRLLSYIGPEAYKVQIHTFHSLCQEIILQNALYFSPKKKLRLIDEVEAREIIRKLIDDLSPDHPLKRAKSFYYDVKSLLYLFETIKKENLSPDKLQQDIETYLAALPFDPNFQYKVNSGKNKKGDPKTKDIKKETDKYLKTLHASKLFPLYEQVLLDKGLFDYHDMIAWVNKAFQDHPDTLLAQYREQFLYVLVDEFQDSNQSQIQLLHALTEDVDQNPNFFFVGDDDQSIYSFQGANMRTMLETALSYTQNLFTVILKNNYRSGQHILDASFGLIRNNDFRLGNHLAFKTILTQTLQSEVSESDLQKHLSAKGKITHGEVKIKSYPYVEHENADVVTQVQKLLEQGIHPNEIAILYKKHKQIEGIKRQLDLLEIPYQLRRQDNVLEDPLIHYLLQLLHLIQEQSLAVRSGEHRFFEVLHGPQTTFDAQDLGRIAVYCFQNQQTTTWRQVLSNAQTLRDIGVKQVPALLHWSAQLDQWIQYAQYYTLQVFFEKVLNESHVFDYVMQHAEKLRLLQFVNTFFNYLKECTAINPFMTLKDFLDRIEVLGEEEIALPSQVVLLPETGIQLTTYHGSKGLEYEYVFLIATVNTNWEDEKDRNNGFAIPKTGHHENLLEPEHQAKDKKDKSVEIEESRRLFYVGLTRAKQQVQVSFFTRKSNSNDEDVSPSQFVTELLESLEGLELETGQISETEKADYLAAQLQTLPLPDGLLLEKSYIDQLLENYSMSVTHLNKYLKCPISFYYENILQIPQARNVNMGFGSAMHEFMENYYLKMLQSETHEFPALEEVPIMVQTALEHYRSHFTAQEFEVFLYKAQENMLAFLLQHTALKKQVLVEQKIEHTTIEGIPINGKLDLIAFEKLRAEVIDYKTGKYSSARKKFSAALQDFTDPHFPFIEKEIGGDYWRQGVFYALLIDGYRGAQWDLDHVRFEFLEPDDDGVHQVWKIQPSLQDKEIVRRQISFTYDRIKTHQFSEGCNQTDCRWCNFVKSQPKMIPEVNEEMLD